MFGSIGTIIKSITHQSNFNKPQAFDKYNATPDPTMRNIHEDVDRYGNVGQSQYNKPQAFDKYNAVPDPTMRNIHEDVDRYGNVGQSQYNKPQAFDKYNAVPDPTMRVIYADADRYGNVGNAQYSKPQAFDKYNAVPDPTMREIHEDNEYYGPVGYYEKQRSRADVRNAYIDVEKEKLLQGRAPTTCNYEKTPSMEGTIIQLCDPVQINRDLYPDIKQQVTPKMPTVYSRLPHDLPNDQCRFYSFVTDNLQGNPYINNTQHKSYRRVKK